MINRTALYISFLFITLAGNTAYCETATPPSPKTEEEGLFIRRIVGFWKDKETKIVKELIKQFREEYPQSEFNDSVLVMLGDIYWTEKEYPAAYDAYRQIKSEEMQKKISGKELECLYIIKNWPILAVKAKIYLPEETALRSVEDDMVIFYYAEALWHQKVYQEAKPFYEKLLTTKWHDNAALALADIYKVEGNPKKAAELYVNLAESHPSKREKFLFQAGMLLKTVDRQKAIEIFTKIENMKGKLAPEACLNHVILLYEAGDYKEITQKQNNYLKMMSKDFVPLLQFMVGVVIFH